MVEDARRFGMDQASIARLRTSRQVPAFEGVWPEHVETVRAFLACATQWRIVSIGGGMAPTRPVFLGLDYAAARAGIEAAGIVITPDLWAGVRTMEDEACAALNEARS